MLAWVTSMKCAISVDLEWPLNIPNDPIFVTSWHCTKTAEQIELIFGTEASLGLSYTVLEGNSSTSKIRVLSSRTFTETLDLDKILQLHVDHLSQLRWTVSVINWGRSSVTSLSQWPSTSVYSTVGVRHRIAWVCQRQRDPYWDSFYSLD